jgi:hypothetical protein
MSSQDGFLITNELFALFKEQKHSQKEVSIRIVVWLKSLRFIKPACLSSAQMSGPGEFGVAFVALDRQEPQKSKLKFTMDFDQPKFGT